MRWALAIVALGCTAPKPPPLTVHAVAWNPLGVDVGRVSALAESGEDLYVFGSNGAHVLSGGATVATDASVRAFRMATTIPAADGNGTWVVAIDDKGRLLRVRDRSRLESISSRFGLETSDVRSVATLGQSRIAFLLQTAVAIVDGDRIARHDYAFSAIAGGGGHGVGVLPHELLVFNPFKGVDDRYSLDVRFVAIDSAGRAIAGNERAIYREDAGRMTLRYRSATARIAAVAASAERVWFRDGDELGVLDQGVTMGVHAKGTLVGSPSGDVWTLHDGTLRRYALDTPSTWQSAIAPIYARVCAACHGPSGSAGLDLSTASRWDSQRAAIRDRVVVNKTMPPPGHPLSDEDRAAIAQWAQ